MANIIVILLEILGIVIGLALLGCTTIILATIFFVFKGGEVVFRYGTDEDDE